MKYKDLRKKYLNFFEKKGHKVVPSSSLKPVNSSVLFTTAGMQQFTLHLAGEKDPIEDFGSNTLTSCQKCFRSDDIEEVGDETHHTFFEMLGNWSIGKEKKGYFKKGAISYAFEFLTQDLNINPDKLSVTIFKGNKEINRDEESKELWIKEGIPEKRITEFKKDNFWGPVGETGPCGPSTEIFYDKGEEFGCGDKNCGPNCEKCDRFVEIWNLVLMEYFKEKDGSFRLLKQTNIDTGMGLERMLSILQEKPSVYSTDLFLSVIKKIESISGKDYENHKRIFRILADHIRGVVFLSSEGIKPSNEGQGYILRRLLRRMIRFGKQINLKGDYLIQLGKETIQRYKEFYPLIEKRENDINNVIREEKKKFLETLERGEKEVVSILSEENSITGKKAYYIYKTYGFPLEMTKEIAKEQGKQIIEEEGWEKAKKKHQEISRAGAEKKFGGVGKDANYESAKLHTATHLLHQALRKVLGQHVEQKGSNINPKRLRFDFSHPKSMTKDEIQEVENLVNEKIKEGLEVKKEEMSLEEALKTDALALFKDKYPDKVNVYSVGNFSKEICAGPHVENTKELGEFEIIKEKSSSSGIRRIRAILK